ncbi:hypothetical protein ABKV19_015053, partial [Rosa sericea]
WNMCTGRGQVAKPKFWEPCYQSQELLLLHSSYKGPSILLVPSSPTQFLFSPQHSNWVVGGLFLVADAFFTSLWYILQASILEKYPAVVFIVFFQCLFTTIQSAAFTVIAIKDANAWALRLDMGLIAILYTGIVATVLRYSLVTWCVWKAGAVYCSMFKPLAIIFGVIMCFIFLGDSVYLGSLVGAVIIVTGFYAVMWGKARELEKLDDEDPSSVDHNKLPLLRNK